MTDAPSPRRRTRRRATARQGPPVARPESQHPPADPPTSRQTAPAPAARAPRPESRRRAGRPDQGRRADHDLAGSGASQVGPTGAMRARDLNRPTEADLAEAETQVVVVRRNWTPAGQPDRSGSPRPPRRRRS